MDFPDAAQKWDARYAGSKGFLFGKQPNAWLRDQSSWLSPRANICCIADGEGRNSVWLAGQGHRVDAFDVSPVAVARSRRFACVQQAPVRTRVATLEQWIDEQDTCNGAPKFDAVVAIFIQFAGPDLRDALFGAIRRTLMPGGVFIIEGYGRRQLQLRTGGPRAIENLYPARLIADEFSGWSVLASRDAEATISEGTGHVGRSHVVSAVVRKPGPPAGACWPSSTRSITAKTAGLQARST